MDKYALGLVSISFRSHTPQEILSAMKQSNLSCIEWGSDVHAPCNDPLRLSELAAMQKTFGITCSSYGTYFKLGETPIEDLKCYIRAAKLLDTNVLRIWCGTKSGTDYSQQEKEELLGQCKQADALAQKEGVILCMECHKNTFTERLEDALALMQAVGSPHFRMYWQPFQWQKTEDNLAYAEGIAKFTHHIHAFQWKGERRLSLHEGIDEWQQYLSKFPPPRSLLLEFMPDDRLSALSTEADALRKIIGGCV